MMIMKKATGYKKAVDKLISLVGEEKQVDDGATTWTLWCLKDAVGFDQDMIQDKTKYLIDDTGVYLVKRGLKQTPAVIRVIT